MILVTGATGNVGRELTRALAARGESVRVLARKPDQASFPAGVQVAEGDLEDPESVAPALDGVGKVFLLGGFAAAGVLRRIRAAGAGHVVLLTSRCVIGGNPENAVTRMWLDAEAAVRDSGIGWTILRPSGFQSNALRWLPQLRIGDVVAVGSVVLTGPGHEGAALTLSGPEPLTPGEQVAVLGRALRRPLRYEPLSDDEARASMADDGAPASLIDAFFRFFSAGEFNDSAITTTVRKITGRPPRTFDHWAHAHAGLFGNAG